MNTVEIGTKNHYVMASELYKYILHTVNNMSGLGFIGEDVGKHLIRSILAMALYLSKWPVSTIMLLGRWCGNDSLL